MRVEPAAFGSEAGAIPTELLGNIFTMEYFINMKIENMLYGHWENYIKFHRNYEQAFAYILFLGHLSHSGDLLLWVGVRRRASFVVR